MVKKFFKVMCLVVAVSLMVASLGACKKSNNQNTSSSTTNKTSTKATSTASAKSTTTSTTKTGTATNKTDSTAPGSSVSDNGGNGPVSEQETNVNAEGDKVIVDSNASSPATAVVNLDLNGRKFVVISDKDAPAEATPDMLALNPKAGMEYRYWKNAEQKFNFVLDWRKVPLDNVLPDYINATNAGVKYADLIETGSKRAFPLLPVKNLLVPVDDYIDFNDPLYNSTYFKESTYFMGKHWGFGKPYMTGYAIFYNRDILQKEGVTDIMELVKSGTWTWDAMVDIGRATTKDLNGDGVIDQWGIMVNNANQSMDMLMFSNGANYVSYINGKYVFTANDPKAIKALQFMSDILNVYKIAAMDKTNGLKFEVGNGAIVLGKLFSEGSIYKSNGLNYGFAPLPKGPDVTEYQNVEGNGSSFFAIPLNTDPLVSATVMKEALTLWDPSRPEYKTKEDYLKETIDKALIDDGDKEYALNNFSTPSISLHKSFNDVWSYFGKNVTTLIIGQQTTPAAALQSVAGPCQQMIDAAMGY